MRGIGFLSRFGSSIAALFSAGAGACAGGVCAVGAQAGASLLGAGASGGLAGMAAASGAPIFDLAPATTSSAALPWWIKVAVVVLIGSIAYTAASLRDIPRLAVLATLGGILVVVAEMRWLPGGSLVEYAAMAIGMVPLLFAPLLARVDLPKFIRVELRLLVGILALMAIAVAIGLQIAKGWQPCPLCWLDRAALLGIAFGALGGFDRLLLISLTGGLAGSLAQIVEMQHASTTLSHVCTLISAGGPSCGVAGSQVLWFAPIGIETAGLFVLLWAMSFWLLRSLLLGRTH